MASLTSRLSPPPNPLLCHRSDLSRKDPRPSNLSRLARLGADLQWGNLRLSHWAFVGGGQGTLVSVAFSVLSVIFVLFWPRVCPSHFVPLLLLSFSLTPICLTSGTSRDGLIQMTNPEYFCSQNISMRIFLLLGCEILFLICNFVLRALLLLMSHLFMSLMSILGGLSIQLTIPHEPDSAQLHSTLGPPIPPCIHSITR